MQIIIGKGFIKRTLLGGSYPVQERRAGPSGRPRLPARSGWASTAEGSGLSVHVALVASRIAASGLGFLTWLVAARLYPTAEVGVASGVVSAMMLCVQVALLGVGAAVITLLPRYRDRPAGLLNAAFSLVFASALVTAGLLLVLAGTAFQELSLIAAQPTYALVFAAIVLFGATNSLQDQVSIALRATWQVLVRNTAFGLVAVVSVVGMALLAGSDRSLGIVSAWVLAGTVACTLGFAQFRRSVLAYAPRPAVSVRLVEELLRTGVPNYLLTLAERTPNWIMPMAVTELLSPTDNAYWYSVWMMAWVVFQIPISVGQNLFADVSRNPAGYLPAVRRGVWTALLLGLAAMLGAQLFAPFALGLLGASYAQAGTTALRIMALAVVPVTFVQAYYALCRGTGRLREATVTGVLAGAVGVGVSLAAGIQYGLSGMAVAWLCTQSAVGLWAGIRVLWFGRQVRQGRDEK